MGRPVILIAIAAAAALAPALGRAAEPAAPEVRVLSLAEAKQLLDAQSPTLAQARARGQEAHAILRQATAPLLPTLVASGNFTQNSDPAGFDVAAIFGAMHLPVPAGLPGRTVIQPYHAFTGAVALRVPLFAANAIWERAAAKEVARSSDAQIAAARLQLYTAVEQGAWWAKASEEGASAAAQAVAVAEQHLESARRAVMAGMAIPLTQLQAETELIRRKSERARAGADRDKALIALGVLLGLDEPVRITLPELGADPGGDLQERIDAAVERRPELKSLEATRRAADRQIDAAWWRLAPTVSAGGSATASDVAFPTGKKRGWRVTLDLQWPLYDGGFRYGRLEQSQAQRAQADAGLRAQRLAVSQEVRTAARDLAVARERLGLAEQQAQVAGQLAVMARASFQNGVAPSLDVIDANNAAYQAQVALAAARAEVGSARAALLKASGELP